MDSNFRFMPQGCQTFPQECPYFRFIDYSVSVAAAGFAVACRSSCGQAAECVPEELHLQKWALGETGPLGCRAAASAVIRPELSQTWAASFEIWIGMGRWPSLSLACLADAQCFPFKHDVCMFGLIMFFPHPRVKVIEHCCPTPEHSVELDALLSLFIVEAMRCQWQPNTWNVASVALELTFLL